jgi:hypothetical protein
MSTSLDAATRQGIARAVTEVYECNRNATHLWAWQMTPLDDDEIARYRAA